MTKDISINETEYQIAIIPARQASWILGQFLPQLGVVLLLPTPDKEMDEKSLGLLLVQAFAEMPEDKFASIQSKALSVIGIYKEVGTQRAAEPLVRKDGHWNFSEPDALTLTALTVASLAFTLLPFFARGALKTLLQVFPDLSQIGKEDSTGISSVQLSQATGSSAT